MMKKRLFLIFSILILSTMIASTHSETVKTPQNGVRSKSCQNSCGNLIVINNNIKLPFPLSDVFAVFNGSEFDWNYNWKSQNITNYYTNASSFNNDLGLGVISNILLPNETWVTVVVIDDKGQEMVLDQNSCDINPPCTNPPIDYIVTNNELIVQQLFPGDQVIGLFIITDFDYNTFYMDPLEYINNATFRNNIKNYISSGVQFDKNRVFNLDPTLNGLQVVVVIKNIDGVINAFDSYCGDSGGGVPPPCNDFRPFVVNNSWIEIPFIGSDTYSPQPSDLIIYGIFKIVDFNFDDFFFDSLQYLINNSAINYNQSASVEVGGIKAPAPEIQGQHVAVVLMDLSLPPDMQGKLEVWDGYCADQHNDMHSPFPFDTFTFSLSPGDTLTYNVSLNGIPDGQEMPFMGVMTDSNQQLTVLDGDNFTLKIKSLPSLNMTMQGSGPGGKGGGEDFGVLADISVRDQVSSNNNMTSMFLMPQEFMDWIKNDSNGFFTFFSNTSEGFSPFQKIFDLNDKTVTLGMETATATPPENMLAFKLTYDLATGILQRLYFKAIPPGTMSPIEAELNLLTDISSVVHQNQIKASSENTTTKNELISTSPGFEALFIVFGLIGITLLKKRIN